MIEKCNREMNFDVKIDAPIIGVNTGRPVITKEMDDDFRASGQVDVQILECTDEETGENTGYTWLLVHEHYGIEVCSRYKFKAVRDAISDVADVTGRMYRYFPEVSESDFADFFNDYYKKEVL